MLGDTFLRFRVSVFSDSGLLVGLIRSYYNVYLSPLVYVYVIFTSCQSVGPASPLWNTTRFSSHDTNIKTCTSSCHLRRLVGHTAAHTHTVKSRFSTRPLHFNSTNCWFSSHAPVAIQSLSDQSISKGEFIQRRLFLEPH